jgi:hypothetical protein
MKENYINHENEQPHTAYFQESLKLQVLQAIMHSLLIG